MVKARDRYGDTLVKLGELNKDIVVLDADLSKSTKTIKFGKKFPDRFFEMGIAEANMITAAAGLSSCGKIPFVSTFAVFATGRVYDQIRMDVAYSNSNVKIFATHGGITVGKDGASHQMIEDVGLMRILPNMAVFCPSDAVQTEKLVQIMAEKEGPMYTRVGRPSTPILYDWGDVKDLKIGEGKVIRDGEDITILAYGTRVSTALDAAKKLSKDDIDVRVVDMYCVKPLDVDLIKNCCDETNGLITLEEHSIIGGLGSAVAETIADWNLGISFKRMGVQDVFCESGSPEDLLKKYGLDVKSVVKQVENMV
ncbi:MAG: transketolase family protein [Candidatus Thermoplasmatota archaeon]